MSAWALVYAGKIRRLKMAGVAIKLLSSELKDGTKEFSNEFNKQETIEQCRRLDGRDICAEVGDGEGST